MNSTCQLQSLLRCSPRNSMKTTTTTTISRKVKMLHYSLRTGSRGSTCTAFFSNLVPSCSITTSAGCTNTWSNARNTNSERKIVEVALQQWRTSSSTALVRDKYYNSRLSHSYRHFASMVAPVVTDSDRDNDSDGSGVIPFLLADIGEGIKEVELIQWFVQNGDTVRQFDRICEVQSDKATVEITSRYDGIIAGLEGQVGNMIQVGDPLCYIQTVGTGGSSTIGKPNIDNTTVAAVAADTTTPNTDTASIEETSSSSSSSLFSQNESDQQLHIPNVTSKFHLSSDNSDDNHDAKTTMKVAGKFLATPAVRKLGKEHNLDLSTLVGTGPNGRVLKADVLSYLEQMSSSGTTTTIAQQQQQQQQPSPAKAHIGSSSSKDESDTTSSDDMITLKGYNRLMVKSMTASLQIPHMVYSDEINLLSLMKYRQQINNNPECNTKISVLAFAIKAISMSLHEYPILNAQWINIENYTAKLNKNHHNIGIAMDTNRGLIVPVIHNVQNKNLIQIQMELNRYKTIIQNMSSKKTESSSANNNNNDSDTSSFQETDLQNATFTISNIGSIGGTYMSPIVVPPQVAIGAMGKIQTLPRFVNKQTNDGKTKTTTIAEPYNLLNTTDNNDTSSSSMVVGVEAVPIMNISWAGDHRLIDGATLGRFSNLWKSYMESPMNMLTKLN